MSQNKIYAEVKFLECVFARVIAYKYRCLRGAETWLII
jgi:hypothetical protein